jgi:hypothetical protein
MRSLGTKIVTRGLNLRVGAIFATSAIVSPGATAP